MTPDGPQRPSGRLTRPDLAVAAGALLYVVLAFFPWASITFDVVGSISSSGYGLSPLVPVSAVLLLTAGAWVLLPASARVRDGVARAAVPLGLAAVAVLLTLVTWLRTSDYGFEVFPLLAFLVTAAVAAAAATALLRELRPPSGGGRPPSMRHRDQPHGDQPHGDQPPDGPLPAGG